MERRCPPSPPQRCTLTLSLTPCLLAGLRVHRGLARCHLAASTPECDSFCKKGPIVHIAQARGAAHRLMVALRRPDPGYGALELWDLQRRGPPVWSCAPDLGGRGSICSLAFASEADAVVAGMCSGSMYVYDVRANRSRCSVELKHSSSSGRFPAVLAMHALADQRSFVAVGEGGIDVWDYRYLNQARHTTPLSRAPLPLATVKVQRPVVDKWPGIAGHSLFDPNVCIVGADFDAGDSVCVLLSTGAAVVMDMSRGVPSHEAIIKPCVDLTQFGPHNVKPARNDDSTRFGIAWGRQGGHRMIYMSDNMSPPPATGALGLSGSNAGIYCFFPDNPAHCAPPRSEDPELNRERHWDQWWARCRPVFSCTPSSPDADAADGHNLQNVRLLQECSHVPLPPGNSRAAADSVIAVSASESLDLVAVATANGHLQTASARKPPSATAKEHAADRSSKAALFSRGTMHVLS